MKKKHFFFADTKQQVDRIKRKIAATFIKPFLFKKQTFLKVKTTTTFPLKNKINYLEFWKCLESQLNLSTESFNLNRSLL